MSKVDVRANSYVMCRGASFNGTSHTPRRTYHVSFQRSVVDPRLIVGETRRCRKCQALIWIAP